MLILHTGDWHRDRRTLGVPRADEVERAVEQTLRVAVDRKVDRYLFTGDLCDPDDGHEVAGAIGLLLHVVEECGDHGISLVLMTGNHDVFEDGSGDSVLSPIARSRFSGVSVVERCGVNDANEVTFVYLPYASSSGPNQYAPDKWLRMQRPALLAARKLVVVATHLSFTGAALQGDETREMARGRDVEFPWEECDPSWLVLAGHYHRRQVVRGPGGREAHVCGSLARLSFGEQENTPAFSLVEV